MGSLQFCCPDSHTTRAVGNGSGVRGGCVGDVEVLLPYSVVIQ